MYGADKSAIRDLFRPSHIAESRSRRLGRVFKITLNREREFVTNSSFREETADFSECDKKKKKRKKWNLDRKHCILNVSQILLCRVQFWAVKNKIYLLIDMSFYYKICVLYSTFENVIDTTVKGFSSTLREYF